MPGGWLSIEDVAAMLCVRPSTVRAYLAREQMPEPDDHVGRSPVWRRAEIRAWVGKRSGKRES